MGVRDLNESWGKEWVSIGLDSEFRFKFLGFVVDIGC